MNVFQRQPQWPRCQGATLRCRLTRRLQAGVASAIATEVMSLSAALLRIFQHSISPDVLTIKGQQNADCKETAMSRRKGVLVFQIPLTERARTSRREREGKEGLERV